MRCVSRLRNDWVVAFEAAVMRSRHVGFELCSEFQPYHRSAEPFVNDDWFTELFVGHTVDCFGVVRSSVLPHQEQTIYFHWFVLVFPQEDVAVVFDNKVDKNEQGVGTIDSQSSDGGGFLFSDIAQPR